ncbi:helix-turn-helix domain-containing protein [Paraburkholderia bannensis]|uniref:transcriptional regulator n=1 Tax=Paraburkholderia bannensis TaxID=765414 RepID=UPI002AB74735|nr:transcriptional regulator [Paraburkholderia bannensis]
MSNITQPTAEQISALIKKHGLSRQEAADLVHVSKFTWNGWVAPADNKMARAMPLAAWELLLIKLGEHAEFGPLP